MEKKKKLCNFNMAAGVDLDFRYLTLDRWEKLKSLDKSPRDEIILNVLYSTGCTVNELVNIRVSDIDARSSRIRISAETSRNKEPRFAYIDKKILHDISDFVKTGDKPEYVLFTRQSGRMTTKRVRQIVQSYCSKAGIKDANPQILRYTHIVHAYMKDIPIDAIQKQVGLKRSRAIEIFSKLKLKDTGKAYEAFSR